MIEREADPDARFVFDIMCREAGPVDLDAVMGALRRRATLVREWETFLKDYPVLVCPVSGELPFEQQLDVKSEADFLRVYEAQLTQRGLPAIGVPAMSVATGSVDGKPVGVQLVAGRYREDVLITAGKDLESQGTMPDVADPRPTPN